MKLITSSKNPWAKMWDIVQKICVGTRCEHKREGIGTTWPQKTERN